MAKTKFDCLVIGDVILDVFVESRGKSVSFLRGGTSYCNFAKVDFGGAGNVASGLSLLGGKVSFIGKAGGDLWGRLYQEDLSSRGVITKMFFEEGISTGLALIVIGEKGERSFYVFRGANERLLTEEIDKSISLLKNSKYLYFSGYSLVANPQREAILRAVKLAKKYKVGVVFDPGAHNLIRSDFQLFNDLLDVCDIFCPNLEEAKAITRTNNLNTAVNELQKRETFTALKWGASGCVLIGRKKLVKIPSFRVDCLDTTGAGDAFTAALIYGLVNHFPLKAIGQLANWFATRVVTNVGARSFVAKPAIIDFLARIRDMSTQVEFVNTL
jgi:sugar/nucleoside kinase (ribokinase family)